jgi:hypothetical protein
MEIYEGLCIPTPNALRKRISQAIAKVDASQLQRTWEEFKYAERLMQQVSNISMLRKIGELIIHNVLPSRFIQDWSTEQTI